MLKEQTMSWPCKLLDIVGTKDIKVTPTLAVLIDECDTWSDAQDFE